MSIPPLVCSTPPPPEQCEDDKEPEDFDLQYSYSQEEDESNGFEFNNFSAYNIHTSDNNKLPILLSSTNENVDVTCNKANSCKENEDKESLNHIPELPHEDDIHIEDLNLIIHQEPTNSNIKTNQEISETDSDDKIEKDLQVNIPDVCNNDSESDNKLSTLNEDQSDKFESPSQETIEPQSDNIVTKEDVCNLNCDNKSTDFAIEESIDNSSLKKIDDDFEDFDEFKFINADRKSEILVESNDPWGNSASEDIEFGNFTANFDNSDCALSQSILREEKSSITNKQVEAEIGNSDDEFGDFDEFKSSATDNGKNMELVQEQIVQNQQVPVLNFQSSNENQIIETINKVLESIFPEEISDSGGGDNFQNKLDISLGETWSYLKQTDTRQPYMVNWNNSLAQKTLLKALCIDSRNILFGPKWSFNTPKYAANLSAAPLQPQKQATQNTIASQQSTDSDKTVTKSSWVDPFASDGQDSCNVENESNAADSRPVDLDVFEAATSTNADKVYSSTLSIQPIRQINLPDTHIFTPTDSETPRSKTIHYDNNSSHNILLPQPILSTVKTQLNDLASKSSDLQNNDEYWEFQEFKSNSDITSPVSNTKAEEGNKNPLPNANYIIETQVLQPIKMEPIMPTLNWPNPGEVKEIIDDFSDFVSKSVPINEKQECLSNNEIGNVKNENNLKDSSLKNSEHVEDDFDMFQSALPTTNQNTSMQKTDFNPDFRTMEQLKSENISFSTTRPTENIIQKIGNSSNLNELKSNTHPSGTQIPNSNILQPITVTPTTQQPQQKAGQILQPLSLESYSQINWPNPGLDLQDLSRFNPVESLQSLKSDSSNHSKNSSPIHNQKMVPNSQTDEDIWGDFVSIKPKTQQTLPKKAPVFADDDEWTDFVSSPSVNSQNGLNTISLNVDTNSSFQKSSHPSKYPMKNNDIPLDIPTLNYITPKTTNQKSYNERHFQNL
ncbi:unnamed protein product [Diatraea saccharalis]|uniref:Aftiphilin clathrin-binding box domain-containing protein n=1 Tax=Diatraea saccharalis TaxID=40085 RepID=A0A9P0C5X5_9NEOP|nr:unnamed protein product [Diatraea saccharalis]